MKSEGSYFGNGVESLDAIIGRYVWSNAGRDKDRLFIIIGIFDDAHVCIADGELRPIGRPKKKKLRHLKITNRVAEEISFAIQNRKKFTDADLRKAIQNYSEEFAINTVSGEG